MKISANGVALIKKYESLRLKSYLCPAGKWTVGYGHTRTAQPGVVITEAEADKLLLSDISIAEACVNGQHLMISQSMFDALVSFVFNIGCGNFQKSTLLLKIKGHSPINEVEEQWKRWVRGGGKVLPGLVKRREEEWRLYAT